MTKKVEKFWSGNASFIAKEIFPSVSAAVKQAIPGNAAVYEVDGKTVSFEFTRIKEVNDGDKPLLSSGSTNSDKGKREKVSERKDNET
tara:strand:- start:9132 stop:9395 length:264 start_codon:yes stop_codon:yes gene_type:complete